MQEIIWYEVPTRKSEAFSSFICRLLRPLKIQCFQGFYSVLFFIVLRKKLQLVIKSHLKKLMVVFKTPLKKFVLSRIIEITTRQGGKNHAKKED